MSWIHIWAPQEPQAVRRNELIYRRWVDTKPPLIFLNRPCVFFASKNQLFFQFSLRLHLVCGNSSRDEYRSRRCEKDKRSERKSRIWPVGMHVISAAVTSGAGCIPGLRRPPICQ